MFFLGVKLPRYALNEPMAAERIEERIRTLAQEVFMSGNSRRK